MLPGEAPTPDAMTPEDRARARRLLQDCRLASRRLSHDDEVLLARLVVDGRCAERHAAAVGDAAEAASVRDRIADGRLAALELELHCLGLVVHIARRYRGRGVDLEDLVQEGWFGIRRAIELWDHRKGFRLSTYAAWWARQAVQRAVVRQGRAIRLPRPVARQVDEVIVARDALLVECGAAPIPQIAQRTGVAPERVGSLLQLAQPPLPIEPLAPEADPAADGLPAAAVTIGEDLEEEELAAAVGHALARLGHREREVVQRRFGFRCDGAETLERIGSDVGVTRERVRQIESSALQKLRQSRDLRRAYFASDRG
jgi:RNA polymerase sigma factor (sigma-70 family)